MVCQERSFSLMGSHRAGSPDKGNVGAMWPKKIDVPGDTTGNQTTSKREQAGDAAKLTSEAKLTLARKEWGKLTLARKEGRADLGAASNGSKGGFFEPLDGNGSKGTPMKDKTKGTRGNHQDAPRGNNTDTLHQHTDPHPQHTNTLPQHTETLP